MNFKAEFLEHKRKTIESFGLVSTDISSIHINLENLKITLAAIESKVSALNDRVSDLSTTMDKCTDDISMQKSKDMILTSTVKDVNNSISEIDNKLSLSRKLFANNVNSLELKLKNLSSQNRKIIKNLINRRLRTIKKADLELETRLKSQRKRIVQLNRKIEGKKTARRFRKTAKRVAKKTAKV